MAGPGSQRPPQLPLGGSATSSSDALSTVMRLQLISLGLLRTMEAIAWTSIFPYVYFMIQSFNEVEETQITFCAGLLVSVFTFCEFLSGMIWARISDRIGRKRTLLVGTVCGMITALSFGLSRSMGLAVASRAFGGLFNPNVSLVQTCAIELVHKREHEARALYLVTVLRSIGNLIGPVLGGLLADPIALYPSLFAPESLWSMYRFLLPNLAVVFLQATSLVLAFLFLPETHPQIISQWDPGYHIGQTILTCLRRNPISTTNYSYIPVSEDQASAEDAVPGEPGCELQVMTTVNQHPCDSSLETQPVKAFSLQILLQIISVTILAFHKVSSDAIMPILLATPFIPPSIPQTPLQHFETPGGFGFSSQKIGIILLSQAMIAVLSQAILIPMFIDKFGPLRAYRIILGIYPATYVLTPFLPKLPSALSLLFVVLSLWINVALSSIGYICSAILITNTTPDRPFLARVNGASASFSCLSRSIGPIITGKLLSIGLNMKQVGIAFWMLGAVALIGFVQSFLLKDYA